MPRATRARWHSGREVSKPRSSAEGGGAARLAEVSSADDLDHREPVARLVQALVVDDLARSRDELGIPALEADRQTADFTRPEASGPQRTAVGTKPLDFLVLRQSRSPDDTAVVCVVVAPIWSPLGHASRAQMADVAQAPRSSAESPAHRLSHRPEFDNKAP